MGTLGLALVVGGLALIFGGLTFFLGARDQRVEPFEESQRRLRHHLEEMRRDRGDL
jgi:hypothetical protein